jgi:mannitol/fructose-specific phosphotransferase system IIA component
MSRIFFAIFLVGLGNCLEINSTYLRELIEKQEVKSTTITSFLQINRPTTEEKLQINRPTTEEKLQIAEGI